MAETETFPYFPAPLTLNYTALQSICYFCIIDVLMIIENGREGEFYRLWPLVSSVGSAARGVRKTVTLSSFFTFSHKGVTSLHFFEIEKTARNIERETKNEKPRGLFGVLSRRRTRHGAIFKAVARFQGQFEKFFVKNQKFFEDFATAKQSRRTDANFCTSSGRYKYTEANGWGNASVENFGIFARTISL